MHQLRKPYLLFIGDVQDRTSAKTAFGLRDWCRADVLGEWSLPNCPITLELPRLSPLEVSAKYLKHLVEAWNAAPGRKAHEPRTSSWILTPACDAR